MDKKLVKHGLDYVRDKHWRPIKLTLAGVHRLANRMLNKPDMLALKKAGFNISIFEGEDFYRINFGK